MRGGGRGRPDAHPAGRRLRHPRPVGGAHAHHDDLYLGVLAHELVHRQFCADQMGVPVYADQM
ncbi:MAG: hypothetical protein R3F55_24170 [Alphaproteobacteria bacterium]